MAKTVRQIEDEIKRLQQLKTEAIKVEREKEKAAREKRIIDFGKIADKQFPGLTAAEFETVLVSYKNSNTTPTSESEV